MSSISFGAVKSCLYRSPQRTWKSLPFPPHGRVRVVHGLRLHTSATLLQANDDLELDQLRRQDDLAKYRSHNWENAHNRPGWSPTPSRPLNNQDDARHDRLKIRSLNQDRWTPLYLRLTLKEEDQEYAQAQHDLNDLASSAVSFIGTPSISNAREKWQSMPIYWRKINIPAILAGSIFHSPELGLIMLSAIDPATNPDMPLIRSWITICDCLRYLDKRWHDEIQGRSQLRTMFLHLVKNLSDLKRIPRGHMVNTRLLLLLRHNTPKVGDKIVQQALEDSTDTVETLLAVLAHYIREEDPRRALDMIQYIPLSVRQNPPVALLKRCMGLLSLDKLETTGATQSFKILPGLVNAGVPITPEMHNIVIENAVSEGAPSVAWEIFRHMRTEKIGVDPRRHLVLLRDAFLRADIDALNEMMSIIYSRDDLVRERYLVAYIMNIVRAVSYHERKLPADQCMQHILTVYDRVYDRAPLIRLGLVEPLLEDTAAPRPQPDAATLGFSVWAMIMVQRNPAIVSTLWETFLRLVEEGDPEIFELSRHPVFYNGMIVFNSRREETLPKCLDVVQTMIDSKLCKPNALTWSKLLCSFLLHKREDVAAQIRQMMESMNVVLEEDDWAVLLNRFGTSEFAQEIRKLLDDRAVPQEVEDELGFEKGDLASVHPCNKGLGDEYGDGWDGLIDLRTISKEGSPQV